MSSRGNSPEHKPFTRWNDYEIDYFLDSYQVHNALLKGKELWTAIQNDMKHQGYRKSLWTLEKKWNNLLRRFHRGGTRENFAHFDKMEQILQEKRLRERPLPSGTSTTSTFSPPPTTSPSYSGMGIMVPEITKRQGFIKGREREIEYLCHPTPVSHSQKFPSPSSSPEKNFLRDAEKTIQELIESYQREIRGRNDALNRLVEELENLVNDPE